MIQIYLHSKYCVEQKVRGHLQKFYFFSLLSNFLSPRSHTGIEIRFGNLQNAGVRPLRMMGCILMNNCYWFWINLYVKKIFFASDRELFAQYSKTAFQPKKSKDQIFQVKRTFHSQQEMVQKVLFTEVSFDNFRRISILLIVRYVKAIFLITNGGIYLTKPHISVS